MDISLVLDRSGSISIADFAKMSSFLKGFGDSFSWGTDATNLAIVNFNTRAFSTYNPTTKEYNLPPVLPMTGNSDTILQTLKGLNCCNANPPAGTNLATVSCCDGWTSISAGLIAGANELVKSVRDATKIIVLITDGKQNTPAGGAGGSCYITSNRDTDCCRYAVGSGCPDYVYKPGVQYPGAQYLYCIGDRNYDTIVDDWQTGQTQPAYWSCTGTGSQTNCNPNNNACNGTNCNPSIAKNKMRDCHKDLINAREYGFKTVGPDTRFVAVGVGDISRTELEIVVNARYRRPSNIAPEYPITWTPVYNVNDFSLGDMSRIISVDNFGQLASVLSLLTSTICGEEVSCQCCSICMCGQCLSPDECPSSDPCKVGYIASGCCTTKPYDCPARNCNNTQCVSQQGGCVYTPLDPCIRDQPECYTYSCGPQNSCVKTPKWQPPLNGCKISGCIDNKLVDNDDKICKPSSLCVDSVCNPNNGLCVETPRTLPVSQDKCFTYICDPSVTVEGQQFKLIVANECPVIDNCNPNVCNPLNGACVRTTLTCNDPTNLCDITPCDPNLPPGTCPPKQYKPCASVDPNNACAVNGTCDPNTGNCVYQDITCNPIDCRAVQCEKETGLCVPLQRDATCDGICANVTNCPANKCFVSQCDPNSISFKENCDTVIDYSFRCTMPVGDFCIERVYCDNTTGCVQVSKPPCAELDDKCFDNVRNSSDPLCCVPIPKNCDQGDPCFIYSCNSTTGDCIVEPKCRIGRTTCHEYSCLNGECIDKETVCPYQECKLNATCIEPDGCQYQEKDCNDNNLCTKDSCVADICYYENECDNCTIRTIDSNGALLETQLICNDNNSCTRDYCDPHLGCVFEAYFPDFCDDRDNCTTDSCPVEVGTCVNIYNNTCFSNQTCYNARCRSPDGKCILEEVLCALDQYGNPYVKVNDTDDSEYTFDCSFAYCSNSTCLKSYVPCPIFDELTPGEVVGLSIGVIVGVAIAVAALVALAGGGAYAVATTTGLGATSTVSNNPLYKDKGGERMNPLHDPSGA